ncbi:MAG: DNA cytosine methyltransferase [Candidatus Omnitrophica bacterium]|nr:DNA cytosine methyltransferase [Candidatus Omnitrophota bacterium]
MPALQRMGSLFSGIGGWEFAARGWLQPLWAVEFAPEVAMEYARNHGHAPLVENIYKVDEKLLAPVDVLVASPPCPGFSMARKATSVKFADELAGLEIPRFVKHLKPWYVAIENAPKFMLMDVCRKIIEALKGMGYEVEASVRDAADYGTPQRRKRTIIRASKRPLSRVPLQEGRSWWDAVQDLELPASKLVAWQSSNLDLLPPPPEAYPVLIPGGNPPSFKASEGQGRKVWVEHWKPAPTIARAQSSGGTRVALRRGDVRGLTVEAFARLSGMPSDILLPGRSRALNILGNTIPPQLAVAALYDVLR